MDEEQDFAGELRGDIEEPMNAKQGLTWAQTILLGVIVGVVVAVADKLFTRSVDRDDSTVVAIAELKTDLRHLSEQIKQLTGQPYVRREEFESRVTGLESRVSTLERRSPGAEPAGGGR